MQDKMGDLGPVDTEAMPLPSPISAPQPMEQQKPATLKLEVHCSLSAGSSPWAASKYSKITE